MAIHYDKTTKTALKDTFADKAQHHKHAPTIIPLTTKAIIIILLYLEFYVFNKVGLPLILQSKHPVSNSINYQINAGRMYATLISDQSADAYLPLTSFADDNQNRETQ
jgi:hypothetical protein